MAIKSKSVAIENAWNLKSENAVRRGSKPSWKRVLYNYIQLLNLIIRFFFMNVLAQEP
jgi:hypothetical protein